LAAKEVFKDILNQVQNYEKYFKLRQRARKSDDQDAFEATVEAVICDLIHHHLTGEKGAVLITRSNKVLGRKSRYRPPAYGKTLPDVLDRLTAPEMGFVVQNLGHLNPFGGNRRTTIKAGEYLVRRIERYDLSFEDLGQSEHQEVIILKRPKADFWDDGDYQDYEDDEQTIRFRDEIRRINRWLAEADISFDDAVTPDRVIDANDRRVRRIFTRGQFNSGGRLFGGFWQNLKKPQRLSGIEIGGQRVIELDFGQMAPTILYGIAKAKPPPGDLYAIPGYLRDRSAIKKLMNAMLFSDGPIKRMPQGLGSAFEEPQSVRGVMQAIQKHHGGIADVLFTGIGHEIQFVESSILIDVLLRLQDFGVVALPIHDALIVPCSTLELAQGVMKRVFEEHVGIGIGVSVHE
jgi:hypothetical protein